MRWANAKVALAVLIARSLGYWILTLPIPAPDPHRLSTSR